MPESRLQASFDAIILGGGIAGLWLLNRLVNNGYNAILFEQDALGSGQTIASQGMIHGGMKYTLGGKFTRASETIADMPAHWQACLDGTGDVDLTSARVLSEHFYLWSTPSLSSRVGNFLASKLARGRSEEVSPDQYPAIFRHPEFRGSLYQLQDKVVDTASVLKALAKNMAQRIYAIDWNQSLWRSEQNSRFLITESIELRASAFIFCAGQGNETLLSQIGANKPLTQRRPLQQVMVQLDHPTPFYGHCIGADKTPRLTISSHPMKNGSFIWYLGGSLAEKGVGKQPKSLIAEAQKELAELMPWLDLSKARWATLAINRAEPRQTGLLRPDDAFSAWVEGDRCDNIVAAWPTKLTLAPRLATQVEILLREKGVPPGHTEFLPLPLDKPAISTPPWEEAFCHATT